VIEVIDDVLLDPLKYREYALQSEFNSISFGATTFHGIAHAPSTELAAWFSDRFPEYEPKLTFLRKSHLGQVEPNFIHDDSEMGDVTAILYLNPDPPKEDGTSFWKKTGDDWKHEKTVEAKFNRAVVFSSEIPHSRAIPENYGFGNSARLIQVLFGIRGN
jgi:hypothetical protein